MRKISFLLLTAAASLLSRGAAAGDCLAPLRAEEFGAARLQVVMCALFTGIDGLSWGRVKGQAGSQPRL